MFACGSELTTKERPIRTGLVVGQTRGLFGLLSPRCHPLATLSTRFRIPTFDTAYWE
jgi:hypothetical protein